MTTAAARLSELLGDPPVGAVADLDEQAMGQLADMIEAALAEQDQSIAESFTKSVKHIPLPLRPLAKRMLLG